MTDPVATSRRRWLGGALTAALGLLVPACGGVPPAPPPRLAAPPLPPLATADLTRLLPSAGLRWLVLVKPREIAAIPWLIPWLGLIAPEPNLDRFAASTGLDLRQVPDAAVASYDDASLYLARHTGDLRTVERLFRERLTRDVRRTVERPDLIRLSGDLGTAPRVLALLGRDVVAFQDGGSATRGLARVATLYALGKLRRSPTAFDQEPLHSLAARLGEAPLRAFARGPFDDALGRGARGLLAAATAVGATARPGDRETILLDITLTGDFSASTSDATDTLLAAWEELSRSSFGHLLGLDAGKAPASATPSAAGDALTLSVALDPAPLARGLRALTSAEIEEIMR
ncbi:hypothetical protein [Chondromyces crocatus]|uniref:Uncharacterized protein n=1 Tax=Chondromyces crocatus TaxID=52 RepID=A0A0K1E8X8_CHOCO|nr:hypothetical protein [Chondromyces crocatus]AKT37325.1 uncharacterized protein CMC5_014580 [Chondromyces crocatus]